MTLDGCKKNDYAECKTYYFGTGAVVTVLWLVAATTLWFLRKRRRAGGTKQNSNITHEMTPVTETKEGGNLIYSSIVFNDDEKMPRMKNSEKEITYAEIKNTAKQDDGLVYADVKFNERRKERENPQRNTGAEATYADVKLSGQSQAENANTDLYASVVKNPKVNVQQNT